MGELTLETRLHYLVDGYIKKKVDGYKTYDHFESSLINIMVRFLGNIFMAFDIYPSKCKSMFNDYGTIFTRTDKESDLKSFTFGCSYGWSEGVHKISIESKDTTYFQDAFGITSNIKHFKTTEKWYGSANCTQGYFYTLNGDSLVTMNDPANEDEYQDEVFKEAERRPNDKLSICLDANRWRVTWYLNDEQLGKPFDIVANETYHLFVSSAHPRPHGRTEYHLINHY